MTQTNTGKARKVKSCVGVLKLKAKQAQRIGLKPRSQLSPLLEKCCLRLCANESYQSAEEEIEALTGVKVGHTTHQRLVLRVCHSLQPLGNFGLVSPQGKSLQGGWVIEATQTG